MDNHSSPQPGSPAQVSMPLIDLRSLDYVNACDENLICPICRCPFVDPVILSDCDHCFCRDCIRQTWATSSANSYSPVTPRKECPSCRTPTKLGLRSTTNKILNNILDDMVVICPNTTDGCTAHIRRGEAQDHVSLYCGYSQIACPEDDCTLSSRRKDFAKGCLHFDACCWACKGQMHVSDLESHWNSSCPDRQAVCQLCSVQMPFRTLTDHHAHACPGPQIPCPGRRLGCTHQSERTQLDIHARSCPLAALEPIFTAQKRRLDEQEIAQKQMGRRMKILENGFSTMRDILSPPMTTEGGDSGSSANAQAHSRVDSVRQSSHQSSTYDSLHASSSRPPGDFPVHMYPGLESSQTSFPTLPAEGPFTSPLHHLLSMHENLRDEMTRVSSALQELEGRQSLQILNENLRTREEMSYLGAQLAGLSRQVVWLTSSQLQQQSRNGTVNAGSGSSMTATSPSVEAAVSAVNTAVRGAARIVTAGREGISLRRGSSEEGRTKL